MKKEFNSEATLRHMLAHPLLSREAEAVLSKRIKAGDETARHELVRHNLRLAWAFAMRGEMGGGARTKDLFGEAVMALYRAAKRFDSALGTFAQFCEFHLREAWRKHARFEGYPTGKSRVLRAQVDQVAWQWLERTGREPRMSEITTALRWNKRQARRAGGRVRPLSLDLAIEAHGAPLNDTLPDEAAESPASAALRTDLRDFVHRSLDSLKPRTRAIIKRRFGFDSAGAADLSANSRIRPLRAVGAALGLSGERVRQLEGEGLAQLRFMLADGIGAERKAASAQASPPVDADPRFSVVHDSTRPRRVLPVKSAESPEDDGRSTRPGVRRLEEEALARLPVIVGGGVFREQGAACDGVTN